MTVSQLRALLANLPDDMAVIFTADMGSIQTDAPTIEVNSTDMGNGDYDGPDALWVQLD